MSLPGRTLPGLEQRSDASVSLDTGRSRIALAASSKVMPYCWIVRFHSVNSPRKGCSRPHDTDAGRAHGTDSDSLCAPPRHERLPERHELPVQIHRRELHRGSGMLFQNLRSGPRRDGRRVSGIVTHTVAHALIRIGPSHVLSSRDSRRPKHEPASFQTSHLV